MKKALIITYYWPPTGGSGVQRWVKFAKYMPEEGWQPVIYTPENPYGQTQDETLAKEIPSCAVVIKRKIFEPYGIYRSVMGEGSSVDMKVLTSSSAQGSKKSWKSSLSLFLRSNLFIPDPRILWKRSSVRFLTEYLKDNPVDVIITTGPPQSMHLIGLEVAKATGIPWIVDFRDPWTKMYWFKKMGLMKWAEKKHRRLEKKVIDNCSCILTVTPFVSELYSSYSDTPVEMITNGFDSDDFSENVTPDGYFNITHTGLFPVDGNPAILWSVLSRMCSEDEEFRSKLKIRLSGQTDSNIYESIAKAGLSDYVTDRGYIDHKAAVQEQKRGTVLILPLRNDPDYNLILPGKLFEYFGARHPIVCFGQEDGACAKEIEKARAGITCDWNNEDKLYSFLKECWNAFKDGRLESMCGNIDKYSRKNLTRELVALFEKITVNE